MLENPLDLQDTVLRPVEDQTQVMFAVGYRTELIIMNSTTPTLLSEIRDSNRTRYLFFLLYVLKCKKSLSYRKKERDLI